MQRRKQRPWRGGAGKGIEPDLGGPRLTHEQYTVEGQIEQVGIFAHGVNQARGWRRRVGLFVAFSFLGALAIAVVATLISTAG